jgi:hypothetical protein
LPALWVALLIMLLASMLLTACASDAQVAQAHSNKAKLDQELTHARTELAIPDRLLTPITTQEQKVTSGDGGLFYNYDDAAKNYNLLYNQLIGVEQTALQTLRQQAQDDLQAFATILNQRRGEGFTEVPAYQARFDDAQQAFANAKTPADYAHVSDMATAQTQALTAMWPAYQKLQDLQAIIKSLHDGGVSTQLAQQLYDEDLQVFRNAASADHYQALTGVIDAQIMQVQADAATAQPYVTKVLLDSFQARIDLLAQFGAGFKSHADLVRQYGSTPPAETYQKQHDDDATQLAAATQFTEYAKVAAAITSQSNSMSSPLIRARALYDYAQLDALVHSVANRMILNKSGFDGGKSYPLAYEYMGENGLLDNDMGIGPASDPNTPGKYARTDTQYQAADFRITSLQANLRAMLDNYDPATDEVQVVDPRVNPSGATANLNPVHTQPHQSDLQLMQYYHVMSGKVIMISLREQVARYYDSGNMVAYSYVTTGDPQVTSVPGFWTAIRHWSPQNPSPTAPGPGWGDLFTPPIPGEYEPTPIHYDIAYHEFGFWLHDAYWRHQFGPETNLPHRDPGAFSGGSHGCVNIPYTDAAYGWTMVQVYNWTPLGTPIILY